MRKQIKSSNLIVKKEFHKRKILLFKKIYQISKVYKVTIYIILYHNK